jgi:hypothetical protein
MLFTKDTIMPIGTFRSRKLSDVPAGYLLELFQKIDRYAPNKRSLNEKYLHQYIKENITSLRLKSEE